MIVGCKLLREDGSSLRAEGRVNYPVGEWIDVPGNGAYVAVTGGLTGGGTGPLLAYLECDEASKERPLEIPPVGVRCFRRVRRLAEPAPERVSPELRGEVACDAPDLSAEQRMELARESTADWRAVVARRAPDLSAEQRMALARESTAEGRGLVARDAPGLSAKQREELRRMP